jgi:hypothetical protein
MPSAQDCAEKLREQAYKTLLPQVRDLEQELQNISNSLAAGVHLLGQKLEALSHIELPTTELVLTEILGEVIQQKDIETNSLMHFARSLRARETQEEILGLLLDAAHKSASRTALFAIRGNRYVGWSSRGFSETLAKEISSCSFLRQDSSKLEESLNLESPMSVDCFPDGDPLDFLNKENQGLWKLIPLHALQRPIALLAAGGAETDDIDTISLLTEFAMLRLENIALKVLYELSSVKAAPAAERAQAELHEAPSITVKAAATLLQSPQSEEPKDASEQLPQSENAKPFAFPESTRATVSTATDEPFEFEPVPPEIPIPKIQAQESLPAPQEEKLHADAKRFARLLVSEIKLYNEHHVREGRENHDLYLRMKRDIDRSRDMYEKRVSPNVSRKIDYFHDEIIRILGDNDPSTLGSDYPGPRVES